MRPLHSDFGLCYITAGLDISFSRGKSIRLSCGTPSRIPGRQSGFLCVLDAQIHIEDLRAAAAQGALQTLVEGSEYCALVPRSALPQTDGGQPRGVVVHLAARSGVMGM